MPDLEPNAPALSEPAALPRLWSPGSSAMWGFIFNITFSAPIHALNWIALGQPDKARLSWIWTVIGIAILAAIFLDHMPRGTLLASWGIWYAMMGKEQEKYVKEKLNNVYEKKSLFLPLVLYMMALGAAVFYVTQIPKGSDAYLILPAGQGRLAPADLKGIVGCMNGPQGTTAILDNSASGQASIQVASSDFGNILFFLQQADQQTFQELGLKKGSAYYITSVKVGADTYDKPEAIMYVVDTLVHKGCSGIGAMTNAVLKQQR